MKTSVIIQFKGELKGTGNHKVEIVRELSIASSFEGDGRSCILIQQEKWPDGKPIQKLEFESEDHAYQQYNRYAKRVGFSIRREYKNVSKSTGVISSRRFVCFKEGFRKEDKTKAIKKVRKEVRSGCPAKLTIALRTNGKYHVIDFEPAHNHKLVDESLAHILSSQRSINDIQALEIELADNSGIRPSLAHELMSGYVGGKENLDFLNRDRKNFLRSNRKRDLKYGEPGSILNYFHRQLTENPSFFFCVQLDEEDQMTNIVWADARMKLDYSVFGDVIFFDTTYRTNKEYRPLAVFVGLNHHYQQVVFEASLLFDETIESFEWLFNQFFECMSGKKPMTIYTDRDLAMANAITRVMPESKHRLCIWHIYQNALENLNQVFKSSKSFSVDFNKCIYDCIYEDEFVTAWDHMLEKHKLQENKCLQDLFGMREKWAMVYGRKLPNLVKVLILDEEII